MTGGKAEKRVFLGRVCDVHPVSDKVTKYIHPTFIRNYVYGIYHRGRI